jgi:uncharacterized protein YkwD
LAVVALIFAWAADSRRPALAAAPVPDSGKSSTSSPQRANQLGVWRHFGDGTPKPSAPAPRYGVWRHFGPVVNPPSSPPPVPAERTATLSATQRLEQQMLELVNADRADPANAAETHGRAQPLRWNERLAAVARAHSLDMLNQGYFAHEDPEGRSVSNRVEAAGLEWQAVGENIALSGSMASAQSAFMNEPRFTKNHRANILNPSYTEIGIGIVQAPNGQLYITQDFYTAPAPR